MPQTASSKTSVSTTFTTEEGTSLKYATKSLRLSAFVMAKLMLVTYERSRAVLNFK
jgi:hypothetical protein